MADVFEDIREKLEVDQIEDKEELIYDLLATLEAIQLRSRQGGGVITDAELEDEAHRWLKSYKGEVLTCMQQTSYVSLEGPAEWCEEYAMAGSMYCKTHQD